MNVGSDDTIDSDVDPNSGLTASFDVTGGAQITPRCRIQDPADLLHAGRPESG